MLGPSAKGVQRMDCVSEVREGNFKVVGDKLPHKFLWEKTLKLPLFLHLSFFYTVMPHALCKKILKWVKKILFWFSKSLSVRKPLDIAYSFRFWGEYCEFTHSEFSHRCGAVCSKNPSRIIWKRHQFTFHPYQLFGLNVDSSWNTDTNKTYFHVWFEKGKNSAPEAFFPWTIFGRKVKLLHFILASPEVIAVIDHKTLIEVVYWHQKIMKCAKNSLWLFCDRGNISWFEFTWINFVKVLRGAKLPNTLVTFKSWMEHCAEV